MKTASEKQEDLIAILQEMGHVAVAFSGGVDSTYLLKVAHKALGSRVVAITARHRAVPMSEQNRASLFCEQEGISFRDVVVNEMEIPGFRENPPDRCYLCKREIFTWLQQIADEILVDGEQCSWIIVDGSNLDDQGDYRPGMRALKELGVRSPLKEAGMTKADIREMSKALQLPTWKLPSFACLASRFVYGEEITPEKLKRVELAEEYLKTLGFEQYRVRVHGELGNLARLEVYPEQFALLLAHRDEINAYLSELGFTYITMDLGGFSSGSMNKSIKH